MGTVTGSDLLAKSLRAQGVEAFFYIMGGPMLETESAFINLTSAPSTPGTSRLRP